MNSKYDLVSGKPFGNGTYPVPDTLGFGNIIRAPETSDFPECQRHTGTCQLPSEIAAYSARSIRAKIAEAKHRVDGEVFLDLSATRYALFFLLHFLSFLNR
jgi:hypothetical protein